MQPAEYARLIDLYGFAASEREHFEEIDDYCADIAAWLATHELATPQLFRSMLAGFYIDWLACVHLGRNFRTIPYPQLPISRQREQMNTFNFYLGRPIRTTLQYVILLRCHTDEDRARRYHGRLARFVIDGRW